MCTLLAGGFAPREASGIEAEIFYYQPDSAPVPCLVSTSWIGDDVPPQYPVLRAHLNELSEDGLNIESVWIIGPMGSRTKLGWQPAD